MCVVVGGESCVHWAEPTVSLVGCVMGPKPCGTATGLLFLSEGKPSEGFVSQRVKLVLQEKGHNVPPTPPIRPHTSPASGRGRGGARRASRSSGTC